MNRGPSEIAATKQDQDHGTPDVGIVFDRAMTPGVTAVVDKAVDVVNRAERCWGCRHVVQLGQTPVFLDVQQPNLGLRCARCALKDVARHDPTEELTCDECRVTLDLLHGGRTTAEAKGLRVSDTRGHHRVLDTPVTLFGFGLCHDCLARLDEVAA